MRRFHPPKKHQHTFAFPKYPKQMERKELSSAIQVFVDTETIWIGQGANTQDSLHNFTARVRLHPKLEQYTKSKCLSLRARLHRIVDEVREGGSDCNSTAVEGPAVRLEFSDGARHYDKSLATVKKRMNNISVTIARDYVKEFDKFFVVVEVDPSCTTSNRSRVCFFGRSNVVEATGYILRIFHSFHENPFIKKYGVSSYSWVTKHRKENKGLLVHLELIDSKGNVVEPTTDLALEMELVYSNGFYAPETPFIIQRSKAVRGGRNFLLKPLSPIPKFCSGDLAKADFRFRIEEVSCRHCPDDEGFQLRVSLRDKYLGSKVHSCLSPTIIVLSRLGEEVASPKKRRASCPEELFSLKSNSVFV